MKSLIVIAALSISAAGGEQPAGLVRDFYSVHQKSNASGLPNATQFQAIAPFLTPGLQALIRKAQQEQSRCVRKHPGEKGPWIEGHLFSSNFEGITRIVSASSSSATGLRNQVEVTFEYVENGHRVTWKDVVVLTRQTAVANWQIDDILYRGGQQFTSGFGASLRRSLSEPGCPN